MKWLFVVALIALGGCTAVAQSPTPDSAPETVTSGEGEGRRFKIKLDVTSPGDLAIKEGDRIVAGQVLADRVRDRTRLEFEKARLLDELKLLRSQSQQPARIKALPQASFSEEMAALEQARQLAYNAVKERENQQRKLDVLQNLEDADVPKEVIDHEVLILEQSQREEAAAAANAQAQAGKVNRAKELQQEREYQHSLEVARLAAAHRDSQLKSSAAIADLESRLSQVEVSLSQLSAVRSPYAGRIQAVRFLGQTNTALSVELWLVVLPDRPTGGAAQTPEPSPGDQSR